MREHRHQLILVQVDDIPGEIVGDSINALLNMGASNVQVISTITKKNRPGHIFLIDCPEAKVDEVGQYLLGELSVGGYHILASTHVAQQSHLVKKKVEIRVGDHVLEGECVVKVLGPARSPYGVKVEHDSIVELKHRLKSEVGLDIGLNRLGPILNSLCQQQLGDRITAKLL